MLRRSPKRDRWQRREARRRNQRSYEARQRDGIGLYPVPLTSGDIDVLIGLGYLREGAEGNRERVGEAIAAVIREIGRAFGNRDY